MDKSLKKWEEITLEEKVERLRGEILEQRYLTRRIYQLEEQIETLREHKHDLAGTVVIPFKKSYGGNGVSTPMRMDNLA